MWFALQLTGTVSVFNNVYSHNRYKDHHQALAQNSMKTKRNGEGLQDRK